MSAVTSIPSLNFMQIESSDNHPFRVGNEWVEVKDLKTGQVVETKKAGLLRLKSWNKTNRYELKLERTAGGDALN